jgi:acetylxylan esterase
MAVVSQGKAPQGKVSQGKVSQGKVSKGKTSQDQTPCSQVHFVVARGSGEPQGVGTLRTLVNSVSQAVPGVTSEAIVYPAQLDFNNLLSYVSSESSGVKAGKNQITAYVRRCPKTKIVVTGVSQVRNRTPILYLKTLD